MRLSTATIIPLLAAGVAFTGAVPAVADPQPSPTPPTTSTMPQPGPTPPTTGTSTMPQPGTASGSDNGGRVGHGQDNGFGFGNVRPGPGFGDRNHIHHFRLHHRFCFFVHRHVVIRNIRFDDRRVVIVKTIVPGHLVCLSPFRDF
ncbi:hypothetical protein ACWDBO_47265 [Streptomyces mirabilis]|uniref:hypothetical protein n=1 Tax=Streptomyces mirabilis TaxID=68239 RepID=UPI003317C896